MAQTLKIKARIVELNLTQTKLLEELKKRGVNIAYSTLNQKIHGIREFTLNEAGALQDILQIPDQDFKNYFF